MPVIDIGGLRVSCTDTGSGTSIVFVPGLAGSKDWFGFQSSGLSDHYRVISYDLRRAPGGDRPPLGARFAHQDLTLSVMADDLLRVLDSLRVQVGVIVGHSLGGLVAARFAIDHPDRALLLVLSSVPAGPPPVLDHELTDYYVPGVVPHEGFIDRLRRMLFGRKPSVADESDPLAPLKQPASVLTPATIAARLKLLHETDLTSQFGAIDVPTLIIAGSREAPWVLSSAQLMDESIPDCTLEIIEGADQYHFFLNHDRFNSIIADYLAERVAGP